MLIVSSLIGKKDPAAWGLLAMPVVFVLLWSTGFIGAKFGLPYAEPFTFLFIRFVLTVTLLTPLVWMLKISWPSSPVLWTHIAVSGLLVHGTYLGVFSTVSPWVCRRVSPLCWSAFNRCSLRPVQAALG